MTDHSNCPGCRILRKENDELREYNRQLADTLFDLESEWPKIDGVTGQMEAFLRCLYKRKPDEIATREALYHLCLRTYGRDPHEKIIDVVICKLRKVMPKDSIVTFWGRGFMLTPTGRSWIKTLIQKEKRNARPLETSELHSA